MPELKRLLESSPNQETRALLRSGIGDRAPARAAERAAAALGIAAGLTASSTVAAAVAGAGAGGVSASTAASSGTLGFVALAKLFGVGIAAGTLTAGATGLVERELARSEAPVSKAAGALTARAPRPVESSPVSFKPNPATVGFESESAEPASPPTPVPPAPEPRVGAVGPPAVAPARSTPSGNTVALAPSSVLPAPPPPSVGTLPRIGGALAHEVELIDLARAAVAAGAGERALVELARYDRERETGVLDREAWLTRIDAVLLLGQGARAGELARGYLQRFPKDAHETRLREIVERQQGSRRAEER